MQNRTTHLARIIAAASVACAIFTGLAACQEPGSSDLTVGAPEEAAPVTTTEATTPVTVLEDTAADDGGGLPADGALLAATQQRTNPSAFTTRSQLDEQAQAAADLQALAASTTTTAPAVAADAPVTTAAPTTTAAPAPAPAPAPVAVAPAPSGGMSADEAAFLACVRQRESGGNYAIVSANGLYYGAYQFMRSTWDNTAANAGRGDLVGVPPNQASPADQDAMALSLYRWQGKAPWGGYC